MADAVVDSWYRCDCGTLFASNEAAAKHSCSANATSTMTLFIPDSNSKTCFQCESCENFFQDMGTSQRHKCSTVDLNLHDSFSNASKNDAETVTTEKGTNWTVGQTLLLFDCYKEYIGLVNTGKMKKKSMWEAICGKFKEMGYGFSSDQICGRWKSLLRAYKNTKDNNKKSGSSRKKFEFESQLDQIFENDPIIEPECTISSCSKSVLKRPACNEPDDDSSSPCGTPEPPKKLPDQMPVS